ncbi:MAG TPA: hypothetical protein VH040_07315 [Usitatibacter sp.]|nr:hypothetical protein [Usitatibacter sp.]
MPKIAAAFIAMAIVIALVLVERSQAGAQKPWRMADRASNGLARGSKGPLGPDAVLAISPRSAGPPRTASSQISVSAKEYYEGRNYAPLYERLSRGNRTPEEDWVLAKILEFCAMIPDEVPRGAAAASREVVEGRRAQFAAALSPSDPDREKRLAAFDVATRNRCQDLPHLQSTRGEIDDLYRRGAEAGDQKSRVALVADELRAQMRDRMAKNGMPSSLKLGDDQVAVMKQALASSDPTAAMEAARTLWFSFANVSVRETDGKSVDVVALWSAARLIACDTGYPCGPDTSEIAQSCAYQGRCDAGSLRDYFLYYRGSPYDSQVLARYESALRNAARTGDTSFLMFYPAPSPPSAAFQ